MKKSAKNYVFCNICHEMHNICMTMGTLLPPKGQEYGKIPSPTPICHGTYCL